MAKKCYKGFNPDMTCRDFQYEEGKEYETDRANLCECGFHACEAPLDVFGYYPPVNDNGELNKFHEVELEEISDEKSDDTKVVAKKIKIGAELNFFGLAKAHVEWVKSRVEKDKTATNTGFRSAATNTGFQSVATNTGGQSVATNTGDYSVATNTGGQSVATNTGCLSVATNTGDRSAATNTGFRSVATNTGDRSVATSTGKRSVATNTGCLSVATNTGDRSAATNTGFRSVATNTGDRSVATSTGKRSVATNTGCLSVATNTGENSIAVAWGIDSKAMAAMGSYIVIADWRWNEKKAEWKFRGAKMHVVDGKTIKPNVFYMLENGKFVEAENQGNSKEN